MLACWQVVRRVAAPALLLACGGIPAWAGHAPSASAMETATPWRVVQPAVPGDAARRAQMGCTQPIEVGLFDNVASFHAGEGFDADLLQPLADASGCTLAAYVLPRDDIWAGIRAGALKIATMAAATPERRKIAFLIPYGQWQNTLVARSGLALNSEEAIQAWMDRPDFRLGITDGIVYGPVLQSKIRQLLQAGKVVLFPDAAATFAALRAGEIDAMFEPRVHAYLRTVTDADAPVAAYPALQPPPFPLGLAFSRQSFTPAQIANWQRIVEHLILSGTWRDILKTYISPEALADFLANVVPVSR